MDNIKDKVINLINKLNNNQLEYIYHLTCKLFGYAPD